MSQYGDTGLEKDFDEVGNRNSAHKLQKSLDILIYFP